MILLICNKLFGILPSIVPVDHFGINFIISRDVLNLCKDNKMNEKECL